MNKQILEVLYKIKNEEFLSNENYAALNDIINAIENESSTGEIKQMMLVVMRMLLNYFNPEDWDIF